jgi:hypothetical protein
VYGVAFFTVSCLIFSPHLLDYILDSLMQGPKPPPFFN